MDGAVDRWFRGYQPGVSRRCIAGVSRPEARTPLGYTGASGSCLSAYALLKRCALLARSEGFEPPTF